MARVYQAAHPTIALRWLLGKSDNDDYHTTEASDDSRRN
jgi:hypothetical protein